MAAYAIVHRRSISDSEALKKYREGVEATISKFGGRVLVRADTFEVLEGNWHPGRKADDDYPERLVVIEFPDMAALKAWYNSDDYAELREIRQHSSSSDFVAVQGA
jgi:uncharacterized protein (DUF1330 family)